MDLSDLDERTQEVAVGGEMWRIGPLRLRDVLVLLDAARDVRLTDEAIVERGKQIVEQEARRAFFSAAYGERLREERRGAVVLERYLSTWRGFCHAVQLAMKNSQAYPDCLPDCEALRKLPAADAAEVLRSLWKGMAGRWGNLHGRAG